VRVRLTHFSVAGRRPKNEDRAFAGQVPGGAVALAVADGMGGHNAGEVASRVAIDGLLAALRWLPAGASTRARLEGAFEAGAGAVAREAACAGREGMGTTLVVALLENDELWVAHAGDSLALLVTAQQVQVLTRPHTMVEEELMQGRISEADALGHPFRHAVVRSLGEGPVEPDIRRIEPQPGALLVLGSDGLLNHLGEPEILGILGGSSNLEEGGRRLVLRAIENGSDDNVSIAALELGSFAWCRGGRAMRAALAALALTALVLTATVAWMLPRFFEGVEPSPSRASARAPASDQDSALPGAGEAVTVASREAALSPSQLFQRKRERIASEEAAAREAVAERALRQADARGVGDPRPLSWPAPSVQAAPAAPGRQAPEPREPVQPHTSGGAGGLPRPQEVAPLASPEPATSTPAPTSASPPVLLNRELLRLAGGSGREEWHGTLLVEVRVDALGKVRDVVVRRELPQESGTSAPHLLVTRAIQEIRSKARFAPARRGGVPVEGSVLFRIEFVGESG